MIFHAPPPKKKIIKSFISKHKLKTDYRYSCNLKVKLYIFEFIRIPSKLPSDVHIIQQ